jgi:hypothetical protein
MTRTPIAPELKSLVDAALEDQSEEFKVKVLEVAFKAKVEPSDPLFLVLLATGKLEYWLRDCPRALGSVFDDRLQEVSDTLSECGEAAVKSQKAAIASAMSSLFVKSKSLRHNQRDELDGVSQSSHFSVSGWKLAGVVLLSLAIGGVIGWAVPVLLQGGYVGQVNLTREQAKALSWAQSKQGKFASDLMSWNSSLLNDMECKKSVKQLGVTLEIQGKKASSGFCTLWVEPVSKRQFVSTNK